MLADENASGTVSWLLADNLGTIRDVVQYSSGTSVTTIVDHLKFDSFGNITAQSSPSNQPLFAFTGMLLVPEVGLYYDHARWYDAHTGRFLSQDPTGFKAGDANLYRYVGNSPQNFVDPSGLDAAGVSFSGRTGPAGNGWWQYGNFYPIVIGPGATAEGEVNQAYGSSEKICNTATEEDATN